MKYYSFLNLKLKSKNPLWINELTLNLRQEKTARVETDPFSL